MRGAPTDFLFLKIFRRNYLIGPSPIFLNMRHSPTSKTEYASLVKIETSVCHAPSVPLLPLLLSYIPESWTMAKHHRKNMKCYWELGEQFGNFMGTPSFPQKTDFLRLFFSTSSLHRRRLHPLASLGVVTTWWRSKRTFIFANSFYICSHFFFLCISFLLWIQCGSLPIVKSVHLGIFKKLELE